ncbi:MAG: pyruvate kinase [Elusimicrobiaceae bacterium]|nr:pyruvate kinase [Elusimicrobiaceae bacterium]
MSNNTNFCKIVATIGPDTSDEASIEALVQAGVSVFRCNCSHGSLPEYQQRVSNIRKMEQKYNCSLGILFDLQGPKLRIGTFKDYAVTLEKGASFQVDLNPVPGDKNRVCLPHPEIFAVLKNGMELLINDGIVRLRVDSFTENSAQCTVTAGGQISNKKGVNVPGVKLPLSALTAKDRADLQIAEMLGADFIGLSFVQKPEDILELRSLMHSKAQIIAKIEKPSAIEHLREIIDLSDVIMVARGDLGVETSPELVPVLQKKIISGCRKAGKPVIVATQMLESMIHNVTPTRAEASDVANAVYDGVDAVMLSAETAQGEHPVQAVTTMHRIIETVENDHRYRKGLSLLERKNDSTKEGAVTTAASIVATNMDTANVIVTFTDSGSTTLRASKQRVGGVPVLALTPNITTARQLTVAWGVTPIVVNTLTSFDDMLAQARKAVLDQQLAREGENVVITAGIPFGKAGTTNMLYVLTV